MVGPPARCTNCGWTGHWDNFFVGVSRATDITFAGIHTFPCPRCGRPAEVIPGTYDFVGDLVRRVRDADLSIDDLEAIRARLTKARERGATIDPAQFAAEHAQLLKQA